MPRHRSVIDDGIDDSTKLFMDMSINEDQSVYESPLILPFSNPQASQSAAKTLEDYQLYLMMLERAKEEDVDLQKEVQSRRVLMHRSQTETATQQQASPSGRENQHGNVTSEAAKRQINGGSSGTPRLSKNHALGEYQKQLMYLEQQNQIRLEQARLAHSLREANGVRREEVGEATAVAARHGNLHNSRGRSKTRPQRRMN